MAFSSEGFPENFPENLWWLINTGVAQLVE